MWRPVLKVFKNDPLKALHNVLGQCDRARVTEADDSWLLRHRNKNGSEVDRDCGTLKALKCSEKLLTVDFRARPSPTFLWSFSLFVVDFPLCTAGALPEFFHKGGNIGATINIGVVSSKISSFIKLLWNTGYLKNIGGKREREKISICIVNFLLLKSISLKTSTYENLINFKQEDITR